MPLMSLDGFVAVCVKLCPSLGAQIGKVVPSVTMCQKLTPMGVNFKHFATEVIGQVCDGPPQVTLCAIKRLLLRLGPLAKPLTTVAQSEKYVACFWVSWALRPLRSANTSALAAC